MTEKRMITFEQLCDIEQGCRYLCDRVGPCSAETCPQWQSLERVPNFKDFSNIVNPFKSEMQAEPYNDPAPSCGTCDECASDVACWVHGVRIEGGCDKWKARGA